jgi:UDP-N-acetyl-D-glucosamine dehydrogenase
MDKVINALNDIGKSLKGAKVLVLGVAYKKNVDDMRESPAAEIIDLLLERGARVEYSDPHVPRFPHMRNYKYDLVSADLNANMLAQFDCVVIATNHDAVDYDAIKQAASLIVDTRNVYRDAAPNLVKA